MDRVSDEVLLRPFEWIGARARIRANAHLWMPVRVDVARDEAGELFDVEFRADEVDVEVLDFDAADRHLVLGAGTSRFLCGHDERHWFVAAIPERAGAWTVQEAKDALKPQAVWDAIAAFGVDPAHRDRRRTAAFIRQGEWFFIPRPGLRVPKSLVLRDEPIQRGASAKPHRCQFLYRIGGEQVFLHEEFDEPLTAKQYWSLPYRKRASGGWETRMRDAHVYVKGNVRHPDHQTVWLPDWHEVVMNTESEAKAMENVAFLD